LRYEGGGTGGESAGTGEGEEAADWLLPLLLVPPPLDVSCNVATNVYLKRFSTLLLGCRLTPPNKPTLNSLSFGLFSLFIKKLKKIII